MNIEAAIRHPQPVRLTTDAFLLLRNAGAFRDFWKSELLDGELYGTLLEYGKEPGGDETFQIKLRVRDYVTLDEAGVLAAYAKTELIDGVVYDVSPQYREHGFVKDELAYRLRRALEALGSDWHVATEQSIDLSPHSEPQPDIILTTKPRGRGAIPADSIGLVVEVAVNTARYDLEDKARVYAMAGIAEYWVVDVEGQTIHQMWAPIGGGYAERHEAPFGERIAAVTIAGLTVETHGI
jgi:Uma2 family endonuclease